MDGLLKGVKDLALGLLDKDDDTPSRDERSRSSWAEVVSGEQDNEDQQSANRRQGHGRPNQNQWERKGEGRSEEWETEGSRPSSRQPQKIEREGYRRDEGDEQRQGYNQKNDSDIKENAESNDVWETVGKKKQPKHKVQKDQWSGYKTNPNEQQYSDEVEIGASLEPSREELGDLTKACQKLWELDLNRLVPGKDYQIDCGEGKKVYQKGDMAQGTLFSWLGDDVLSKPTFARFCSLLDNYNPNQGYKEVVTPEERQEQAAFIEEISRTAPIKYVHKYLSANGVLPENYNDFKRTLTSLWFDLYNRGGAHGSSSAFEHVFVGEIKQHGEQEVSGFHNWLQFYLEEAKGAVDYQGYIFPRRRGEVPDSKTQLLTVQFEWNGVLKSVSSTLVGVSPEFEVALYTLCFYMGGEDNHVELGPYYINIKCYRLGDKIGSVFPIAEN